MLKEKKPNISLIARKCDVSKMTVSRALRNEPCVAAPTRDMIFLAAEKMGFMPSGCYQAKNSQPVKNYSILFQEECSLQDVYFREIILGIQKELFAHGCGCSLGVLKNDYAEFLTLNTMLRSQQVHGVLVVGGVPVRYVETLAATFLNVIFIDYPGEPGIRRPYNTVCTDNVYGGHLAVGHLLDLGRKRVLFIGGKKEHYFSRDLFRAYEECLTEYKIPLDPTLIRYGDFHVDSGTRVIQCALEEGLRFDAIFSNDEMACGAIKALIRAGIKIPDEVAVVGFDGLPLGQAITPALTTVMVDRENMAKQAVRRLLTLEQETGPETRFEKISLFPTLLIRESCGAKPERSVAKVEREIP
ncbi:MAG: LacI family DNA-binding transcriptional regulator [Phycisphaerae bacterium]